MDSKLKSEIEGFADALRQSEAVYNYLSAKAEVESDGQYAGFINQIEGQAPAGDVAALNVTWQTVADAPQLRAYLQARLALVKLLQEINEQISSEVGFNIAASLQPASCCG